MRRNLGPKLGFSLRPTVLFIQFRHPKGNEHLEPEPDVVLKQVQNNSDNINDVQICKVPAARLKALNKHNTHNAHGDRICY